MHKATVKSLWRYPVKSLLGESPDRIEVNLRGVVHDRAFALTTTDGKLGSGKNTNRLQRIDGLFYLSASMINDEVSILFPDGGCSTGKSDDIDLKLSETLGRGVSLKREAGVTHFDDSPIHILTTGALSRLRQILPDSEIDARRFRANIILDCDLSDDELIGKVLTIGEVELKVTHKTDRCRMVTIEQGSAQQDKLQNRPEILRAISKHHDLYFGIYARVIRAGRIGVSDKVQVL